MCQGLPVGDGDGPGRGCGRRGWPTPLDPLGQAEHGQPQVVARPTRVDLGQGPGRGLVSRLEDAPEDPVLGGGFSQRPRGCGPWGEHGVGPPEDPWAMWLWAGECRGGDYTIVPGYEDCTPDLGRGPVAICRWGGGRSSSGLWWPVAQRAVSRSGAVACSNCSGWFGSAGWWFSARGLSKARGSFVADGGVGVVCQGLAPLDGGDPDALVLHVLASPPDEEVHDRLVALHEGPHRCGAWQLGCTIPHHPKRQLLIVGPLRERTRA